MTRSPKLFKKYIIKIPSINLPYSKKFETLLTSSKMTCSVCTGKQYFSNYFGIVTKVLNFVWTTYRCTYIIIRWLPEDSGPDSTESTESTSSEYIFCLSCQKKLKKPWRQGSVVTKLLELKHLLDSKNSPNEKPR